MEFKSLLGKQLKDDEVIDLLECYDVEVVYDFDRLHENIPDQYWASFKPHGVTLGFDEQQKLSTIFLYLSDYQGFTPIASGQIDGIIIFPDSPSVERWSASMDKKCVKGGQGNRLWARIDEDGQSTHYEFVDGVLRLITLSIDH